MKYINADKLKAEIERRRLHFNKEAEKYLALCNGYSQNCYGARDALRDLENFIDSLQQEQSDKPKKNCNNCPHCVDRKDQYGWHFKGCFGGPYNGKFIAEIDECPLKQEQPSEDLNDEIKKFIEEYGYERGEDTLLIAIVARHFFELRLNARKEE